MTTRRQRIRRRASRIWDATVEGFIHVVTAIPRAFGDAIYWWD